MKSPGEHFTLQTQHMDFRSCRSLRRTAVGGLTLLREVVQGDLTLFVHADETEASWRLYTPLLRRRWPLQFYPAGGTGPVAASCLVHPQGPR